MRTLISLTLALAAVPAVSAAPQPDATKAFTCAQTLLRQGEYLKAVDVLSSGLAGEKDPDGLLHQFSSQVTPFITGMPGSVTVTGKPDAKQLQRLGRAALQDAIPEIVERAKQTNVVILNEEHGVPRDRAFAVEVARALRPLGYSYLAAESFASSPEAPERQAKAEALLSAGYARQQTGLYTKDPVFADFVRESLALGYRPIVYEYVAPKGAPEPKDQIAAREQGEAANLVSAIFTKNPKAKVLIYVGYSHAAEAPLFGNEWMASRLKRMTGIDPLTIDQTTLSPTATDSKGRALYAALKSRLRGGSVVPMVDGKPATFSALGPVVDLQVAHPPIHLIRGRPDWLLTMGRSMVEVSLKLRPRTGRVLVQAFNANDAADAVPLDQVVVTAGHKPPPLVVPHVPLRFAVRTGYQPGDCDAAPK